MKPLSIRLSKDTEVLIYQRFTMWGDSEILWLQIITSHARIQNNLKRGMCFSKLGAKINENSQSLDLGTFLKILIICGKKMTSEGKERPLMNLIGIIFK